MEVIPSEFARMAGVSATAISKKIKNKTLILNSSNLLDTDNTLNRAYLELHRDKQKKQWEKQQVYPPVANSTTHVSSYAGGAADAALNMTIRELLLRHGSIENIEKFAKVLRDLSSASEREQKVQERRMELIQKDFVVSRLFGFVEQLAGKLLDVPEAVADQVIALSQGDESGRRRDVVNYLADNISRAMGGAKEQIIKEMDGLRGKYERQESREMMIVSELERRLEDNL